MKHFAKRGIARLWMVVLLASLSMVTVSAVASAVKIGDEYGGGIIFYIDRRGQHGLIAANEDIKKANEDIKKTLTYQWDEAMDQKSHTSEYSYSWSTGQHKNANEND